MKKINCILVLLFVFNSLILAKNKGDLKKSTPSSEEIKVVNKELLISNNNLVWPPRWWSNIFNRNNNGSCSDWSDWVVIETKCKKSYLCIFSGQQAKFVTEERYCNNSNEIKETRTFRQGCGCK